MSIGLKKKKTTEKTYVVSKVKANIFCKCLPNELLNVDVDQICKNCLKKTYIVKY